MRPSLTKPRTFPRETPTKPTPTDRELLSGAVRLDENALALIYNRYSTNLYRYAARLLGDQNLAEDCVAEAYCRLLEALNQGGGPKEHLQAYLYQIAHNWITDQFRNKTLQTTTIDTSSGAQIGDNGNETARIAHEKMEMERVRSALAHLKPDQRQVIALKYLEGWDNEEIASLISKSSGAVRVIHHRGVANLKKLLRNTENSA